jgi:hypothetical protein
MPNKEQALELFDAGLLPLPARGKAPTVSWRDVAQDRPSRAKIASWFDKDRNIWIATGEPSGIVVIDCDSRGGDVYWRERLGAELLDNTTCVKTSKGYHYWLRIPVGESIRSWSSGIAQREMGISFDIRGDGGGVIAPPSVHESGHVYTFVRGLDCLQDAPIAKIQQTATDSDTDPNGPKSLLSSLLSDPPSEGGRDVWITRVAGHLAKIVPYRDAYLSLLHTINRALPEPLTEDEIEKKIGVWDKEHAKPDVPTADSGWLIGDGLWLYTETVTESGGVRVSGTDRWCNADLEARGVIDGPLGRTYAVTLHRSDGESRDDLIKGSMLGRMNDTLSWLAKHGVSVVAPKNDNRSRVAVGARLLRYLESQQPTLYKEVPHLGWVDGIGFVTHEGVITASGMKAHEGVMPNPALQNLAPFVYGMGNPDRAVEVLREVLTFHDETVTAVFGAWWIATLLKGQYMGAIGHFPYFAIEASSESGKTRGFFRLMLNLAGTTRFGEWTKAATRDAIGAHRNGIVHIDDSNRLDNIADLLRQATGEGSEGKKAADNTGTVDIKLVSPVLITGESLGELGGGEKAQRDRRVLLTDVPSPVGRKSTKGDYPQWDDVKRLERVEGDLSKYAGTMVMLALQREHMIGEVTDLRTGHGRHHEVLAILRNAARILADIIDDESVVRLVDAWCEGQRDFGSENTLVTKLLPWAIIDEFGQMIDRMGGEPPAFVENGLVYLHPDRLAAAWQKELRKRGKNDRLDSPEAIRAQLRALGITGSVFKRTGVGRDAPKARYVALDGTWSERVIEIANNGWE